MLDLLPDVHLVHLLLQRQRLVIGSTVLVDVFPDITIVHSLQGLCAPLFNQVLLHHLMELGVVVIVLLEWLAHVATLVGWEVSDLLVDLVVVVHMHIGIQVEFELLQSKVDFDPLVVP